MPFKDKERKRQWFKEHMRRKRALIARYKVMRGCDICGYNKYFGALGFHHTRDKYRVVNEMLAYSKARLKAEIAKCDLLCANCHAEVHGLSVQPQVV